jgi:hypothetical protein
VSETVWPAGVGRVERRRRDGAVDRPVDDYHRPGIADGVLRRRPRRWYSGLSTMTYTLEISDELRERLDSHLEEDESYEEFITELVSLYETEGTFLQEGYSE